MGLSFEKAFGVHAAAVSLRSQRAELLAANVANADTPGYKARDLDFAAALAEAGAGAPGLRRTDAAHLGSPGSTPAGATLEYRVPLSPSLDGNTVDAHMESMAFLENALRYQASLQFLDGRISGIRLALRGE